MPAAQQYDPTSAQPYTPVQLPDPKTPPAESPFGGQPGVPLQQMGNITHGGAIAGVFDGLLHGFVNGYAQGEQHKALTLKKKQDDLSASYNADAKRWYDVAQSQLASTGKIDPNSDDYKLAKSAADGSWGALQDFRGQLLQQGKKTKGQKKDQDKPPTAVLTDPSSSHQEKAQALFAMSQKAGSPVSGQIQTLVARYGTPQAQSQRATQDNTAHTAEQMSGLKDRIATLTAKPNRTPEEQTELEKANEDLAQYGNVTSTKPQTLAERTRYSEDGKEVYTVDAAGNEVANTRRPRSAVDRTPKVGTFNDFISAAYGPHPTAEQTLQGRTLWAKSAAMTTTGTHEIAVPQPDGSTKLVQVETTSTKAPSGSNAGSGLPAARQDATPGSPAVSAPAIAAPAPSVTPTRRDKPARQAAPSTQSGDGGHPKPGDTIGGRKTPTQTKADEDVVAATKLNSLAVQAVQSKSAGQQRQLALALIKGMAGRVNMQEYSIYTQKYGVANTIEGITRGIEDGTLPTAVVGQLARDAYANLRAAKDAQKVAYAKQDVGGTVKMKSPTGQVSDVTADQVEHYKSLGAVIVK